MLKMTAIGNLGKDAVEKEVSGKKVINFSIAHSERWKDAQGNYKERITWVECALWDNDKLLPYLKKGQQVYVEGIPASNSYVSGDAELKSTLRLNVFSLQLLSKPRHELDKLDDAKKDELLKEVLSRKNTEAASTENNNNAAAVDDPAQVTGTMQDDDLPF